MSTHWHNRVMLECSAVIGNTITITHTIVIHTSDNVITQVRHYHCLLKLPAIFALFFTVFLDKYQCFATSANIISLQMYHNFNALNNYVSIMLQLLPYDFPFVVVSYWPPCQLLIGTSSISCWFAILLVSVSSLGLLCSLFHYTKLKHLG